MDRRRFDAYEINLTTGELRRDGRPVALQRQPARVLARLVADAGTLVPRETLQAAVWGPEVHVDFDRGLNYCIRQLRETLGDAQRAPRFIATIPRQGYRFIAPVSVVASENARVPAVQDAPTEEATLRRPSWRPSQRTISAALMAAAVLALAVDRAAGGNSEHHRIAVAVARAIHDAVF
jgi:DNA-binding winged helix-turn-helix (wHTH) protein